MWIALSFMGIAVLHLTAHLLFMSGWAGAAGVIDAASIGGAMFLGAMIYADDHLGGDA